MKQVLFLAAIYALIFHQSNKNTKNKISSNQKNVSNNIVQNDNRFNRAPQHANGPFVLNENTFSMLISYKSVLENK